MVNGLEAIPVKTNSTGVEEVSIGMTKNEMIEQQVLCGDITAQDVGMALSDFSRLLGSLTQQVFELQDQELRRSTASEMVKLFPDPIRGRLAHVFEQLEQQVGQ